MSNTLFEPYTLGNLTLKNKVVMSPMTRCRSTAAHVPHTELMGEYYQQRANAGLIITEGTAPSANGVGYARIPGLYNAAQVEAWKTVTDRVHAEGAKIFAQLMHTGRVSHLLNMPSDAEIVGPSAVAAQSTQMYTDQEGNQKVPVPRAMTTADIEQAIQEFVSAAKNAIAAGFDGVELHAANGYLLEQFLNPHANHRTDEYGGSKENRARFVLEIAKHVTEAIGSERTGIRLSPGGAFNDVLPFDDQHESFVYLAEELKGLDLVYVHLVDHSAMGAPAVDIETKKAIRDAFGGTIIVSGGYNRDRATQDLDDGLGHLVAFGRPFIANPDLVSRMKEGKEIAQPNFDLFYTPGPAGYTDYPTAS
ncbi:MAG: alkene reductase [Bacteroidota bacterium]